MFWMNENLILAIVLAQVILRKKVNIETVLNRYTLHTLGMHECFCKFVLTAYHLIYLILFLSSICFDTNNSITWRFKHIQLVLLKEIKK